MMKLQELLSDFLRVLGNAQKLRSEKVGRIGDEYEWMLHEHKVMLQTVNAIRLQRERPLVEIEEVRRVEGLATGHIDYSQKFALYCVHLALETA